MSILIFANGEMKETAWARPYLQAASLIIAADGGLRHLLSLGRWPDVLIGDMDSLPHDLPAEMPAAEIQLIHFSRDKDETDLELALLYAAEVPDAPILIFGALGGRLDQMLANVMLLAHPALFGRDVRLVEPGEQSWLVTGETRIAGNPGDLVSLLPLAGDVEIAGISGLQWPLHHETLHFGLARGVSNVLTAAEATVRVNAGKLLCIHSRK